MKINDFNYFWHNLFKRLYRKKSSEKRSESSEKKKYSLRKKEKSPKKRSIDSEKEWKKESTSSGIRTHEAYATDLKSVPFDRSGILVVCL